MTPQEQQMLQGLIDRVAQTQLPEKDGDAESLLQSTLGQNPDALYILAQTVLVQQYALQQAQQQIAQIRQQIAADQQQLTTLRAENDQLRQQPAKHTSFLGSLLGHNEDPAPRPPAPPPPAAQPPSTQPGYTPVPAYPGVLPSQAYGQPTPYPPGYGSGFGAPPAFGGPAPGSGGFLRGALQTASGVAAGALAFEGIESLLHGFGHSAGYGSGFGSGFGGGSFGQPREEIINNYYNDPNPASTLPATDHPSTFLPDFNNPAGSTTPQDFAAHATDDTSAFNTSSNDASSFADPSSLTDPTDLTDDPSSYDAAPDPNTDDNSDDTTADDSSSFDSNPSFDSDDSDDSGSFDDSSSSGDGGF